MPLLREDDMKLKVILCLFMIVLLSGCGMHKSSGTTPGINVPSVTVESTNSVSDEKTDNETEGTEVTENESESGSETQPMRADAGSEVNTQEIEEKKMVLKINDVELAVEWEDNESVEALMNLAKKEPLIIDMSMYGGFEQVGSIGTSIPRNDEQTTTSAGDIVLYSGNQIVVFYGSNSWAYTRLGKIEGMSAQELSKLLGNGDVTLTISIL